MQPAKLILFSLISWVLFTTSASAQTVVRIANIGHGYYAGPLYVAMRENLFQKYGLVAEVSFVQGGPLAFQSVFARQADFGILSYEHILTAAAQGRHLVSIFNVTHRPLNNIIVSNKLAEATTGMTIKDRMLALKGKRIGTPSAGGSGEKILGVLAKRYGLKLPGDIELVYLGPEASSYVGAFKNNLIDAAIPFEPAGVQVEIEKLGKIFINLMNGEVEEFRNLNYMTVAASPATLAEKPELARKVVAVFAEAQKILLDPVRGKAIMGAEFSSMAPVANDRAYEVVKAIWSPDGKMSAEGGKKVFDYLQPPGTKPIDYSKTFTNDFLPK
jgi:NitT/TauT family transport system substrate-binding protein